MLLLTGEISQVQIMLLKHLEYMNIVQHGCNVMVKGDEQKNILSLYI